MPARLNYLPLPPSPAALRAELARLERELGATHAPSARQLMAIERRRVVLQLDRLMGSAAT